MKPNIFRAIAAGILIGIVAFFFPPLIIIFLVFFLVRRLLFPHRFRAGRWDFIDRVRSMSDEEFAQWKARMQSGHCGNEFVNPKA